MESSKQQEPRREIEPGSDEELFIDGIMLMLSPWLLDECTKATETDTIEEAQLFMIRVNVVLERLLLRAFRAANEEKSAGMYMPMIMMYLRKQAAVRGKKG